MTVWEVFFPDLPASHAMLVQEAGYLLGKDSRWNLCFNWHKPNMTV